MSYSVPNQEDSFFEEIHQLVAAGVRDELSDQGIARLEELVLSSPAACSHYLDEIFTWQTMRVWADDSSQDNNVESTSDDFQAEESGLFPQLPMPTDSGRIGHVLQFVPTVFRYFTHRDRVGWVVSTALMTVALVIMSLTPMFVRSITPSSQNTDQVAIDYGSPLTKGRAVARIVGPKNGQWDRDIYGRPLSSRLYPGDKLSLKEGLVQVAYFHGVNVILEGPFEYEIQEQQVGRLKAGKLFAHVFKETGYGFTVETPTARIEDLGTEFGVEVYEDNATDVVVFSGSVHLSGNQTGGASVKPTRLAKGQSAVISNDGSRVTAQRKAEPSLLAKFHQRLPSAGQDRQSYRKRILDDPGLVAFYDFQADSERVDRLVGHGNQASGLPVTGRIHGPIWATGSRPSSRALLFSEDRHHVKVDIPAGPFPSMTLMTLVCVDEIVRNTALFHVDSWETPGAVHWLLKPNGALYLAVSGAKPQGVMGRFSVLDQPSKWVHLAVTCDSATKEAAFYVDGQLDSKHAFGRLEAFRFGPSQLGNWSRRTRNLSGCMEEFLVFSRALSGSEIAQLYQLGGR